MLSLNHGLMWSRVYITFILLFSFIAIHAEKPDSVSYVSLGTFELMPIFNPWLQSTNPAGHLFDPAIQPGKLDLNYNSEVGDYKRVQQGDSLRMYNFRTERYMRVNKTLFYGGFSYDKSLDKNCNYTLVNDPYRGTPYQIIDTMNRDDIYDREFFTLRGDISTPILKNLSWGLSADMNVGLASQDRDPRPRNKVMNLELSQGLLLSTEYVNIGLNGIYSYYNEDIEVDIIKRNTNLAFLQLHGFDTYTYHIASSFYRLYKRNTYGGETQLNLRMAGLNTLFGGKLLFLNETADDGRKAGNASWSYMKNDSELEGNEVVFYNASTFRQGNAIHSLNARYMKRYMVGAEILQRLEQVGEAGAVDWVDYGQEEKYVSSIYTLSAEYSFLILKNEYARNVEIKLGATYFGSEQSYYLPDMDDGYQNRILSASLRKSFYFGRHEFGLGAGLKLKNNLSSTKNYDETSFISEKLLTPDFSYLTSDYKASWLHVEYVVSMNKIFDKYFISSDVHFYKGSNDLDRTILNFSTGVIFK
jgi:hypothetical protein